MEGSTRGRLDNDRSRAWSMTIVWMQRKLARSQTERPGGPPETTRATVLGRATAGPSLLWDHNLMRPTAVQSMERRYCRSINTFYVIVSTISHVWRSVRHNSPHLWHREYSIGQSTSWEKVPRFKETEDNVNAPRKRMWLLLLVVWLLGTWRCEDCGCMEPKEEIMICKCAGWLTSRWR